MRSPSRTVSPRPDLIAVLEALYEPEPDTRRWALRIADVIGLAWNAPQGMSISAIAHGDHLRSPSLLFGVGSESRLASLAEVLDQFVQRASHAELRAGFYPGGVVRTHLQVEATDPAVAPIFREFRAQLGAKDVLGILAYPMAGVAMTLAVPSHSAIALTRSERLRAERLAGHLESAFRLRSRPETAVAAVISPSGRLLEVMPGGPPSTDSDGADGEVGEPMPPDAGALASVGARVVALERLRLRARRRDEDALDHWQALVAGRYSIVPHDDRDGKRCYLLVANAAAATAHARLTPREVEVVRGAARGLTRKGIAYGLGLSPAVVSVALTRAAAKVGLGSRAALVQTATTMFGAPPPAERANLTAAERDVFELLRRGLSNQEIARLRERSARTVANQVASILRKTRRPSRGTLVAGSHPLADEPAPPDEDLERSSRSS